MSYTIDPNLTGPGLAWVLAYRLGAPLDRLGELSGSDLAMVLIARDDAHLDHLGKLTGWDLTDVLTCRPDAGGTRHADIHSHLVWSWNGTLTVGCETHPYAEWIQRADGIDAKYGSPELADKTRALAERLMAEGVTRE